MFKWHADGIASVALTVALVAVLVTGDRMQAATVEANRANRAAFAESTLVRVLSQTIHLTGLSGKLAPPVLRDVLDGASPANPARGYILFVYTPSACERSIKDGLETIRTLERPLANAGLSTIVVSAVDSVSSKELAILTRNDIAYTAPLRFASRKLVERAIFDPSDSMFGEEPVVILLDAQQRMLTAMHTDQYRPTMLQQWLGRILDDARNE